jgi:ring-1,2-phenylacetyl-CoA epoxidase subunit PaaC
MQVKHAEQAQTNPRYKAAVRDLLLQLADDELCIGHRDSEWLGLAPDIEEDVAFSSIAQDEVGHAAFYLNLLRDLNGEDPDAAAFCRKSRDRRNAVLAERPNGDWAETIVRRYFYDVFDEIRTEALRESSYMPLAQGVAKIRREERYHLMHFQLWFTRLGAVGGEARERMNRAVEGLWPEVKGCFSLGRWEQQLIESDVISLDSNEMERRWLNRMKPVFAQAGLQWPGPLPTVNQDGRCGEHSSHLEELLQTMGEVVRQDPAAGW